MRTRSFMQVDVFTDTPFLGNPVAVVLEADDLDTDQMQRIARWTNLSETTFVQTATDAAADYRLRIFTPMAELPFAGHPTLGSAHALLQAGRVTPRAGRLVQQCAAGLVPIRVDPDTSRLWLSMPSARFAPVADEDQRLLERIVGGSFASPARLVDVGPRWIVAAYGSTQTLLEVTPDLQTLSAISERLHATGQRLEERVAVRGFIQLVDGELPLEHGLRGRVHAAGQDDIGFVCGTHVGFLRT